MRIWTEITMLVVETFIPGVPEGKYKKAQEQRKKEEFRKYVLLYQGWLECLEILRRHLLLLLKVNCLKILLLLLINHLVHFSKEPEDLSREQQDTLSNTVASEGSKRKEISKPNLRTLCTGDRQQGNSSFMNSFSPPFTSPETKRREWLKIQNLGNKSFLDNLKNYYFIINYI